MTATRKVDLTEDRIFPLGWGLVFRAVCAPASWTPDRIEADVNANSPTGISSEWRISDPAERDDAFNGCNCIDCPDDPNRKHWLLNC